MTADSYIRRFMIGCLARKVIYTVCSNQHSAGPSVALMENAGATWDACECGRLILLISFRRQCENEAYCASTDYCLPSVG